MSSLEKILISVALLLVIALVGILIIPDAGGQSGFRSLSSALGKAGTFVEQALSGVGRQLASWTGGMGAWVRQGSTPSNARHDQGNPIDNAVKPAASFGQQQKDLFGKPVEKLQP